MGNERWFKIECFHEVANPESKRLKVAALNLFHPTAPPLFLMAGFFILRHNLQGEGEGGDGVRGRGKSKE